MAVSNLSERKETHYLATKKKVAPAAIGFLSAFVFLAIVILTIIAIFVRGTALIVLCSIIGACLLFMIISKFGFAWEKTPCFYKIGKDWYYGYHGVVNAMGNTEVEVKLVQLTQIKAGSHRLTITGKFIEKQPLQKAKTRKKYVIHQFSDSDVAFLQQMQQSIVGQ